MGSARWVLLGMLLSTFGQGGCGRYDVVDGGPDDPEPDADGWSCPDLCTQDEDCCEGMCCRVGICTSYDCGGGCPSGCNYECDKSQGQRCDQGTMSCVQGPPPLNCQTDCNCYVGERCVEGACLKACEDDEDCDAGMECRAGSCLACGGLGAVCATQEDCCSPWECHGSVCVEVHGCSADSDCSDPSHPRCDPSGRCEACTFEFCPQGTWCDTDTGECQPGCDSNDDCTPGVEACDYPSHECRNVDCCGSICEWPQHCDSFSCLCVRPCEPPPLCETREPPSCCPAGSECDPETSACVP